MSTPNLVFLFASTAALAALEDCLASSYPGASFHSLEERPHLALLDVGPTNDAQELRATILVVVLSDTVPEATELREFVAGATRCLIDHERRAVALPLFVSHATAVGETLASACPDQQSFTTRFSAEPIFAVKGWVLSLLAPRGATLANLDWAEFSRTIALYGFSVERVPAPLRLGLGAHAPTSPLSVPDFASFVTLALERRDPAVAIDFSRLPLVYNGTTEYSVNVSRALVRHRGLRWAIIASRPVREAFQLDDWNVEIVPPERVDRVFDLVFVPHQIYNLAQLKFVTSISLRHAICMLDAIALRCSYLHERAPSRRAVCNVAVAYADALISLSKADADDVRSYYESEGLCVAVAPILITKDVPPNRGGTSRRYALVVGNQYRHKAIDLFLDRVLEAVDHIPLVVVADEATQAAYHARRNVEVLASGSIPEERMSSLYENAAVVVFPSLYEGFGLPVLGGLLRSRPVLALDTQVNREVKEAFDAHGEVTLVRSHAALADSLRTMTFESPRPVPTAPRTDVRSWADVAEETYRVLDAARARPIAWPVLQRKLRDVRNLDDMVSGQEDALLQSTSFRRLSGALASKIARRARRTMKRGLGRT